MSIVVALRKDNVVYFGCDMQSVYGDDIIPLTNKNNYRILKVNGLSDCYIGHVGNYRFSNIIRSMDKIIDGENLNYESVVNNVIPNILNTLLEYEFIEEKDILDNDINATFILAYKDKLFVVGSDCSCFETDDYYAIGPGDYAALGSLFSSANEKDPYIRLMLALKAAAFNNSCTGNKFIVGNTKDGLVKII